MPHTICELKSLSKVRYDIEVPKLLGVKHMCPGRSCKLCGSNRSTEMSYNVDGQLGKGIRARTLESLTLQYGAVE